MESCTHIIWIWWNANKPNPRLPAYIIPSLVSQEVTKIIFTSSVDCSKKNAKNSVESERILFETDQKLILLQKFRDAFFDTSASLKVDIEKESNNVEDSCWLNIWWELEKHLSEIENQEVQKFLIRIGYNIPVRHAKIYAVRHVFWFYDLSFSEKETHWFTSIWWPSEKIFNIIRNAVSKIEESRLLQIFWNQVYKNEIKKIIFPFKSRVVPYWQGTRKSGKKSLSLEYETQEWWWDILEHYSWRHHVKSHLHTDIQIIHGVVSPPDYQDFYQDFLRNYRKDILTL